MYCRVNQIKENDSEEKKQKTKSHLRTVFFYLVNRTRYFYERLKWPTLFNMTLQNEMIDFRKLCFVFLLNFFISKIGQKLRRITMVSRIFRFFSVLGPNNDLIGFKEKFYLGEGITFCCYDESTLLYYIWQVMPHLSNAAFKI